MHADTSSINELRPIVSVNDLTKVYGDLKALDRVSFSIQSGEIFGLIGPDGAGKTTAFHILAGIMQESGGQVFVIDKNPRDARLQIGYLTQVFSLYTDLSIAENMEYAARIREVPPDEFRARKEKYLRLMDLDRFEGRLAGQLSGGMKQKLALCCALVARPSVLLLDEPTTGVDPISRRDFWDVLASIAAEGVTVAVATPYLDEAERCNRIALLHKGKILKHGTPNQMKDDLHLARLEVRSNRLEEIKAVIASLQTNIADVQEFGDRLDVLVQNPDLGVEQINSLGTTMSNLTISVEKQAPTLENVFVASLKEGHETKLADFPHVVDWQKHVGEAIAARNINKHFGHFQAVKDVTLTVKYGEIYGLLGANGAGKTTTIKMLCGLLEASSGEMMLAGHKSDLRKIELRKQIGYMSQKFVLYDDLTVLENLNFYCGVYQIPVQYRKARLDWALSTFELYGQENTFAASLPGGWKQKLSFAASVLHKPSILFLDEPTSGVDPMGRRQLWHYIRQFADDGTAVLVTTHFLEEAEHCQQLGFMDAGELVAQGTPSEIKQMQPGQLIELKTDQIQKSYDIIKSVIEPWRVSIFGDRLHIVAEGKESEKQAVEQLFARENIQIVSRRIVPFSLEDAFIGIVHRRRRGD
jgi:ABC-2 type transport system ATP-binding protein